LVLTDDDRVLLRAIAIAGDAVRVRDIDYLIGRWPWATPMDRARIVDLEAEGYLHRSADGWFVPLAVEVAVTRELPKALDPVLRGFVGEMLCRGADSMDRLQLGVRRMIAGGRETALVSACRVWGDGPAGQVGPRGARFVEALGAFKLGPELRVRLRAAVPELEPVHVRWFRPMRDLGSRVARSPAVSQAVAAAAALLLAAIEFLGRAADSVELVARR